MPNSGAAPCATPCAVPCGAPRSCTASSPACGRCPLVSWLMSRSLRKGRAPPEGRAPLAHRWNKT
ncbi:hypothetical protein [Ancylobacter tetraedralis]|uniref:hypothetical protein n=1 Tax=Ancylobacter tetraedralis TaxID=217068 RepID=UPI003CCD5D98